MSDTAINPINIPSLQPKNQVNFQQNPSYTQPPMQGTGSEQIRQSVDNSYLANISLHFANVYYQNKQKFHLK